LWHWGSCTKALTATLLAGAVDEGGHFSLGWDTSVGSIIPEFQNSQIAKITLKQLAHHRSGMLTDLEPEEETQFNAALEGQTNLAKRFAWAKKISEKSLLAPPGTQFCYSNAGYALLSVILETTLKKPYEDLIIDRIAKPLGLTTLRFGVPAGITGYTEEGDPKPDYKDCVWNHASFSAHSTLQDWGKFASLHAQALKQHILPNPTEFPLKIVSVGASSKLLHTPASPAFLTEPHGGSEAPKCYAMAWYCQWDDSKGEQCLLEPTGILWHFGTNFLFNAGILIDLKHGLICCLASNSGSMMARLAMRLAFEEFIENSKV